MEHFNAGIDAGWHSYGSVYNLGHRAVADLFRVPVNIEEKVDGSQFSFGYYPGADHELRVRSKRVEFPVDAPEGMFKLACATVRDLFMKGLLTPGWTYRGEVLAKPKHNALAYDRVPNANIVIFDINIGRETYLPYADKLAECERIGLECVPALALGVMVNDVEKLRGYLDTLSMLGGQKVEGIVIKPQDYNLYAVDKHVLMGKFVSEAFREVHKQSWKADNPTTGDIIATLAAQFCTPARWNKAIQHLLEEGRIAGDKVQDIGTIIKEIPQDVCKECADDIKDALFKYAWPHIARACTRGFPEFYKDRLMRMQFDVEEAVGLPPELAGDGDSEFTSAEEHERLNALSRELHRDVDPGDEHSGNET